MVCDDYLRGGAKPQRKVKFRALVAGNLRREYKKSPSQTHQIAAKIADKFKFIKPKKRNRNKDQISKRADESKQREIRPDDKNFKPATRAHNPTAKRSFYPRFAKSIFASDQNFAGI